MAENTVRQSLADLDAGLLDMAGGKPRRRALQLNPSTLKHSDKMLHPSNYSYNSQAINRLVNILIQAAEKIPGVLRVDYSPSRISASRYIYVTFTDTGDPEDADQFKIRVSDHDDKYGGNDLYIWEDTPPHRAVEKLASFLGVEPPPGFEAEVFEARSASAKRAAETRMRRKIEREAEMVREFAEAMRTAPDQRRTTLCRLFEQMFPGPPARMRIRVMDEARRIANGGRPPARLAAAMPGAANEPALATT